MYGRPWHGDGKEKCRQNVENQTAGEVTPATDNNTEIKVFIGKRTGTRKRNRHKYPGIFYCLLHET